MWGWNFWYPLFRFFQPPISVLNAAPLSKMSPPPSPAFYRKSKNAIRRRIFHWFRITKQSFEYHKIFRPPHSGHTVGVLFFFENHDQFFWRFFVIEWKRMKKYVDSQKIMKSDGQKKILEGGSKFENFEKFSKNFRKFFQFS